MPRAKGSPNNKYSGEFKQKVVEDMRKNNLSQREAAEKYEITNKTQVLRWERIYLEEGCEALYVERRGQASSCGNRRGRPPKLGKKVEEDLIAENQRLRMENAYLKKLNALVRECEISEKKRKRR